MKRHSNWYPFIFGVIFLVVGIGGKQWPIAIFFGGGPIVIAGLLALSDLKKRGSAPQWLHTVLKASTWCFGLALAGIAIAALFDLELLGTICLLSVPIWAIGFLISLFFGIGYFTGEKISKTVPSRPKTTTPSAHQYSQTPSPKEEASDLPVDIPHTDLDLPPFIRLLKSDNTPTESYLHQLFEVRSSPWVFMEYIALDARNGTPYFVRDEVRHVGGAYGGELFPRKIRYEDVQHYAAEAGASDKVRDLGPHNWQDFIPKEDLARANVQEPPKKTDPDYQHYTGKGHLSEFYLEFHNVHAHHITYLRQVATTYRVFHATSRSWNYGLPFRFDRSEEMIRSIILEKRYGTDLDAFDRALSPKEMAYIHWESEKQDDRELLMIYGKTVSDHVWNKKRISSTSRKWEHFAHILAQIAISGLELPHPTPDPLVTMEKRIPSGGLLLYCDRWTGKAEDGVDWIIAIRESKDLVLQFHSYHRNVFVDPPLEKQSVREARIPFDDAFDWYLSQLIDFAECSFTVKLGRKWIATEQDVRTWIHANAVIKRPAYEHHFNKVPDRYQAYRDFSASTHTFLVLESQYQERCHYIAIHKTNGKAYEVYSKVEGMVGPSHANCPIEDFEHPAREISYDELIQLATSRYPDAAKAYQGIDPTNWRTYLDVQLKKRG